MYHCKVYEGWITRDLDPGVNVSEVKYLEVFPFHTHETKTNRVLTLVKYRKVQARWGNIYRKPLNIRNMI